MACVAGGFSRDSTLHHAPPEADHRARMDRSASRPGAVDSAFDFDAPPSPRNAAKPFLEHLADSDRDLFQSRGGVAAGRKPVSSGKGRDTLRRTAVALRRADLGHEYLGLFALVLGARWRRPRSAGARQRRNRV